MPIDFPYPIGYTLKWTIKQSSHYDKWWRRLEDARAKKRIGSSLRRMEREGRLLGDWKIFDGIIEFRFGFGPGYRVYAALEEDELLLLLAGGDKGSQSRDIFTARQLLAQRRRER